MVQLFQTGPKIFNGFFLEKFQKYNFMETLCIYIAANVQIHVYMYTLAGRVDNVDMYIIGIWLIWKP